MDRLQFEYEGFIVTEVPTTRTHDMYSIILKEKGKDGRFFYYDSKKWQDERELKLLVDGIIFKIPVEKGEDNEGCEADC